MASGGLVAHLLQLLTAVDIVVLARMMDELGPPADAGGKAPQPADCTGSNESSPVELRPKPKPR